LPDLAAVADEIRHLNMERTRSHYSQYRYGDGQANYNHIARVTVPYLSWPMDLETKLITLSSRYLPKRSDVSITVTVDKDNQTPEIYERKKASTRRFHFDMAELNMPRKATGGIGGDVSVEIKRGRL